MYEVYVRWERVDYIIVNSTYMHVLYEKDIILSFHVLYICFSKK